MAHLPRYTMNIDNVTKADIGTLLADDFEAPTNGKPVAVRKIGFTA